MPASDSFYPEDYFDPKNEKPSDTGKVIPMKPTSDYRDHIVSAVLKFLKRLGLL
jgi:hypothetical protein